MKKLILAGILAMMGAASAVAASYTVNPDSDSCWDPPKWCVSVEDTRWRNDNFKVTYRNNCEHRVYIKKCNQRKNGSWSCGATGLGGGNRTSWDTYDASGKYAYRFIGVLKGSKDWVCAGKVNGWNDDF